MSPPIIHSESTPIIHTELTPIINSELPINEQPKCCTNYYPRVPYTHINYLIDDCITSPYTEGQDMNFSLTPPPHPADPLIFCGLCTLVLDILFCIPMIFGCYKVNIHRNKAII